IRVFKAFRCNTPLGAFFVVRVCLNARSEMRRETHPRAAIKPAKESQEKIAKQQMQNWDMWGGSKSKPSMEVEAATYADERIGPKILTQPADLDIYEKQNAEFSISADLAEGTTSGELSYQWYQVNRSGYRATLADGEGISGTLTDTLTLSGVT
ncbi:MAG TPA: hypothetical protein DEQ02_04900, partial [Ruminococcaceae bacterium]|nr:hypothetical protein [Oscillospiraceae bacterium]